MTNLISANDQKIIGSFGAMMGNAMQNLPAEGDMFQLDNYRYLMKQVNRFKDPEGCTPAPVDSYDPAAELWPGLTAAVAVPEGDGPFPVLVHAHGHGLRAGRSHEFGPWIREMASHGFVVVFPDYRWQPEHTYDDQLDDMNFGIDWAIENAAELKADPGRVVLGGDSLGAHLAFDVLLRHLENPDGRRFRAFLNVDGIVTGEPSVGLPDLTEKLESGLALPPVIVMTGSADLAFPSCSRLSQALHAANLPFFMDIAYGMIHDYLKFPNLDAMKAGNERMMELLNKAVG